MPLLLVLLFVVVPILELFVLIQVGGAIGVLPTIGLLVVDSLVGAALMRSQGRAAWRRFQAATAAGKVPAREVLDGALVIFGGALLLTPGFVTDLLGLALLVPATRALVRRGLLGGVARRMLGPAAIPGGMAFRYASGRRAAGRAGPTEASGAHGAFGGASAPGGFDGASAPGGFGGASTPGGSRRAPDEDVVDGTAHDVDASRLP